MKNIFKKIIKNKRFLGFLAYMVYYVVFIQVRFLFSRSDFNIIAIIVGIFGFIIFLIIIYGLTLKKYKLYSQGVLLGWVIFILVSFLLNILLVKI